MYLSFFKPTFPTTKKVFIRTVLGFIAIVLRKHLEEKDENSNYFLEATYIVKAQEAINKEFFHIVNRLKDVGMVGVVKEKEVVNELREKKNSKLNG